MLSIGYESLTQVDAGSFPFSTVLNLTSTCIGFPADYAQWTEGQMNDFYASRIIIEVIDTCRKYPSLFQAAGHMAAELKETRLMDYVRLRGLPLRAGIFLLPLRLRCFPAAAAAGARFLIWLKERGLA